MIYRLQLCRVTYAVLSSWAMMYVKVLFSACYYDDVQGMMGSKNPIHLPAALLANDR